MRPAQLDLGAPRGWAFFSFCRCGLAIDHPSGLCRQCGAKALYREALGREIGGERTLAIMGVNPSTATAEVSDPTITKDIGFARRLGFGRLVKLNLFAWRDTDVRGLLKAPDPIGPGNDDAIRHWAARADLLIAAWGAKSGRVGKLVNDRAAKVLELLAPLCDVHALRLTKDGHPEHTLFLPGDLKPLLFRPRSPEVSA